MKFNYSGGLLATAGDNCVKLWNSEGMTLERIYQKPNKSVTCMDFSKLSDHLVICTSIDFQIEILRGSSLKKISVMQGHADSIQACCFSHRNKVVTGGNDRQIKIWDLEKSQAIQTFVSASTCNSVDVNYSDRMYVSGH